MADTVSALQGDCPRCGESARLRARTFSDQAMAALVAWQEISEQAIVTPICDECYGELREVLIDRQEELAGGVIPVASQPAAVTVKKPPENQHPNKSRRALVKALRTKKPLRARQAKKLARDGKWRCAHSRRHTNLDAQS